MTCSRLRAPPARSVDGAGRGALFLTTSAQALDIRLHPDTKQVFVQGLSRRGVASMEDVDTAMRTAQANRSVGKTNMNEHSSRSHLVLTLTAAGKDLVTGAASTGNLTLIDLAGSERLAKSDASGDRLKEAQAINKSLSALGDVIQALGERGKTGGHIPFRNSKLTYLLQDQLSGNAKVGFFVNVSPVEWNVQETLCSLKVGRRPLQRAALCADADAVRGEVPQDGAGQRRQGRGQRLGSRRGGQAAALSGGPAAAAGPDRRAGPALGHAHQARDLARQAARRRALLGRQARARGAVAAAATAGVTSRGCILFTAGTLTRNKVRRRLGRDVRSR
jgi:hypothetical protein